MSDWPSFPASGHPVAEAPGFLRARGYALRRAAVADRPALAAVYADTRAAEMAGVTWPSLAKQEFLAQQFDLQHRHYVLHYADADFMVVEHEGRVCGRFYLRRTAPDHLVVDISLLAKHRGLGVGTALIRASQSEAQALGRGVGLHVARGNAAARRLYERLGFEACDGGSDTHQRMRWPSGIS